ncbi:MAG: hypothetical protein ACOC9J_02935 [Persicimonas sp.]
MPNVQLLDGKDVIRALKQADVELFHYGLNRIGYTLVVGLGALILAAAGAIWWQTGLDTSLWKAVFGGLMACGILMSIQAAYWYSFANTRFVGISEDKLFVGRKEKAWVIDWDVLDSESLGFDDMKATAVRGELEVNVGGEEFKIHLYNAYIFLDDIQGLTFSLLKRLQQEQDGESEPEDKAEAAAPQQ